MRQLKSESEWEFLDCGGTLLGLKMAVLSCNSGMPILLRIFLIIRKAVMAGTDMPRIILHDNCFALASKSRAKI